MSVAGKKAPSPEKLLPLPGDPGYGDKQKELVVTGDQFIDIFLKTHGGR